MRSGEADTRGAVSLSGAAVWLAFNGDAERPGGVDHQGNDLWGDQRNTQPLLVMRFEANLQIRLDAIRGEVEAVVKRGS